uniref:Pleurocidin-like peptide WF3 n=1 Tax=Fundulus heteroclitus TaxID=8078 RepID=A0A3Q2QPM4_FUNHE
MKGPAVFLVLSLVVMMAEPAEGIFGLIAGLATGIGHAIHGVSSLIRRRHGVDEAVQELDDQDQQQLEKLLFENKLAQNRFN